MEEAKPAEKLKQYRCNDCQNEFWVDVDLDADDVEQCPICYVNAEGVYDTDKRINVPPAGA